MNWAEHYKYDENSPSCLLWARLGAGGKVKIGDVAGKFTPKAKGKLGGYYRVFCIDRSYAVHRIVWEMHNGSIPEGLFIDHINGNNKDNRLQNLRLVTNRTNAYNQKRRKTNKSGVNGVHLTNNGSGKMYWTSTITLLTGKLTSHYSVDKHGNDEAFKLAVQKREEYEQMLEGDGAQISTRHGREE